MTLPNKKRGQIFSHNELAARFNDSLATTLGIKRIDYYSGLNFEGLLRLKSGYSRINDLITVKLTIALVNCVADRLKLDGTCRTQILEMVERTDPNANGFDLDWLKPNVIGEVKGNIPINGEETFGGAQDTGLTNDVLKMLGQRPFSKKKDVVPKTAKLQRENRARALKFLGLYASDSVKIAARKWRRRLLNSSEWKQLIDTEGCQNFCIHELHEVPVEHELSPDGVYIAYLKPSGEISPSSAPSFARGRDL